MGGGGRERERERERDSFSQYGPFEQDLYLTHTLQILHNQEETKCHFQLQLNHLGIIPAQLLCSRTSRKYHIATILIM